MCGGHFFKSQVTVQDPCTRVRIVMGYIMYLTNTFFPMSSIVIDDLRSFTYMQPRFIGK